MKEYFIHILLLCSIFIKLSNSTTYFKEDFTDESWKTRWIVSKWKSENEIGKWKQVTGEYYTDPTDKGLKTSEDARFYGLSATLDVPFKSENHDLIIQYLVQHEQSIDCGGAYIKLLKNGLDQSKFGGDSPYGIMFGPDICGHDKKTHVILNYNKKKKDKDENLEHNEPIRCEDDDLAHFYTLILKKDNTYDVKIDGESVKSGKLVDNWNFLLPKKIKDPKLSKPIDWVDEEEIPDPNDKKPDNFDDHNSKQIPDPNAKQPEDWDKDDDGAWEPPMIDNPEYKGEWEPKLIKNPLYKGEWVHPLIDNPDYVDDSPNLYKRCDTCSHIGFELWQVKSGTLFDDILITDNIKEATKHEEKVLKKINAIKDKYNTAKAEKDKAEKEKAETEAEKKDKKDTSSDNDDEKEETNDDDKETNDDDKEKNDDEKEETNDDDKETNDDDKKKKVDEKEETNDDDKETNNDDNEKNDDEKEETNDDDKEKHDDEKEETNDDEKEETNDDDKESENDDDKENIENKDEL